jgi:hypothetical protein
VQPLGSSQHFMEPEGSLPNSQDLSTCTYPEPDQSSPQIVRIPEVPPPPRLKTETDPVSETLCFLFVEIRTMDKVQKLSSNECYTPSSEPFRE